MTMRLFANHAPPAKKLSGLWSVHLACLAILTIIISIIYSNTFHSPFVFDDIDNIVEKTSMQMTTLTYNSLHRAVFEGRIAQRWLPNLSYALNYYFGGGKVWGYHLLNLLVHIATAMVLYGLFFTTLTLPRPGFSPRRATEISLMSALLWAVHPLQTNAVTYIVQRMTSMGALFYLASLLLYVLGRLKGRRQKSRYGFWFGSLLCALLALGCKENSGLLPLIIFAYEFYFLRKEGSYRYSREALVALAIAVSGFLLIARNYIDLSLLFSISEHYGIRDFTLTERLLTEARVIFHYLSLIVYPLPSRLNLTYDYEISHGLLAPPITMVAVFGILLLIGLTIYLFKRERLLSFGLLWFLANLVIESTVIPLELVFEHRLYLPSSMLIFAVVVLLSRFWQSQPWARYFLWSAVIIVLCLFTWQRNAVWASEISLWQDIVEKSPGLPRAYSYLGRAYNMEGRYQEAFDLFEQAPKQEFNDVNVYNNWGKAAFQIGKIDRAVELLEHAVKLSVNHYESHYNLGLAYSSQGRIAEARQEMAVGMGLRKPR